TLSVLFFSSRRRHTRSKRDWSSDVCSSDLLVGADGETHQGVFDISFISPLPNTVLMMPKDEIEAAQMIDLSLRHEGPAAIRYPRGNVKGLDMGEQREPLRLGEWEEVVSGENMAIISFGPT